MGPALACQSTRRPLFALLEDSLGRVPTLGLRVCSVVYLVFWVSFLISLPLRLWSNSLDREASSIEFAAVAAVLAAFCVVTGQQKFQTVATLASFTNKLTLAILVAALIRVRDGWPAVLEASYSGSEGRPWDWGVWAGVSELAFYAAPLLLLASSVSNRIPERRQVGLVGLFGVSAPLMVTLLLVGVTGAATHASHFYQPSLQPSVAMALWSRTAASGVRGRILVAGVTIFGAVRFGSRFVSDTVAINRFGKHSKWIVAVASCAMVGWLSLHPFSPAFTSTLDWSARCLAVSSAVLTVDFVTRKSRTDRSRAFDPVGMTAVIAGLLTPLYILHGPLESTVNPWWYPWLLPSYFVALSVCLCGRIIQKTFVRQPPS